MTLAAEGIYSILHKDHLDEMAASKTPVELRAKKRWVTAEKNFIAARARGLEVPLLYADAALDCSKLLYWGKVIRLEVTDSGTEYAVADLTPIRRHRTQELVLASTGARIAEGYLRPYAIVRTPDFIRESTDRPPAAPPVTLFSFGYWGCGAATSSLVHAIAAAEKARGFRPPLWVDIRIRRSVRAVGFRDDAFERLLGAQYEWMCDLGNVAVIEGGPLRIKNPGAAETLLDRAFQDPSRRIIFFCACESPASCHRSSVAKLLLRAARERRAHVTVVEWPGGTPDSLDLEVSAAVFRKIAAGNLKTVPLTDTTRLAHLSAVAWGSKATVRSGKAGHCVFVGPARFDSKGAHLPILTVDQAGQASLKRRGFCSQQT